MVAFSDTSSFIREVVTQTLSTTTCSSTDDTACRDDAEALTLKLIAIGSILVAGVTGISIPLIGSSRGRAGGFSTDSNLFIAAKAFAAGVILATGFVHMLPDASSNLTDSCLPTYPWSYFPFSGFFAMCSALLTLLADFIGTQMYESKEKETKSSINYNIADVGDGMLLTDPLVMEENGINAHIIGVYAHADQHGHDHNNPPNYEEEATPAEEEDGHGHSHGGSGSSSGRHAVVSQVLELGIVSHSVIIGLSIGVSHSPCVIRPLVAALSFHQFFEGFALGGCISQAKFKTLKTALMATFFALTTPLGIGVGISIASSYDADSARALVIEGVLDAVSAGILIYMSLVDLIAADFMSKKMRCNLRLQIVSYFALFMGATLMSSLAIWS